MILKSGCFFYYNVAWKLLKLIGKISEFFCLVIIVIDLQNRIDCHFERSEKSA